MNFYNEHDPKAAAWLRELIRQKQIPEGIVDERSIVEIQPNELSGYAQCHFFAGIGGWSLALRLAGVPDDEPLWTGSCPCQPFSAAGKQHGTNDPRHLWPDFFRLIRECRPNVVFGEQVEAAVRLGWLDGVSADLEGEGYAVGSIVLGAHSLGAPHIRQRLFWVADARCERRQQIAGSSPCNESEDGGREKRNNVPSGDGENSDRLADAIGEQTNAADARGLHSEPGSGGGVVGMGDAIGARLEGHAGDGDDGHEPGRIDSRKIGSTAEASIAGYWDRYELIPCRDGKARRIESPFVALADGLPEVMERLRNGGTLESESAKTQKQIAQIIADCHPLANSVPHRTDLLRGYGNAIVPAVAAEFIKAFKEITNPH